jgi:uncharacterized protein (DUF2141 family)
MRRWMSVSLFIAVCAVECAQAADIEVEIRGIKVKKGHIHAALFANAADFVADLAIRAKITQEGGVSTGIFTREDEMPRPPAETLTVPVSAKSVQIRFADIAPGVYALGLYQDVNDDGKLDTRMDGKPLEPWGLSNNPKIENRDATWDEVKFELPPEGARLIIELQQ